MPASLRATNRSLADTAQIFESDSPASVLRFFYKPLADRMVGLLLKTGLLSRELLEFAFGRFGLFLLEIATTMFKDAPIFVNSRPAEILSIRIGCNIHYPKVHTKCPFNINWLRRFHITRNEQVEPAFDVTQITFPALTAQKFQMPLTSREGDILPTLNGPDRNFLLLEVEREDAIIECNRSMRFENSFALVVNLICVRHLGNTSHYNLRGKLEFFPNTSIRQFVKRKLAKGLFLPCLMADVVTSNIGCFKRFAEQVRLIWQRKEFDLGGQLHS